MHSHKASRCEPGQDQGKAAFHTFKNVSTYFQCWNESLGPARALAARERSRRRPGDSRIHIRVRVMIILAIVMMIICHVMITTNIII